jgi:hypothetical protein
LAWTHTDARVQLCLTRAPVPVECSPSNILAPTNNRLSLGKVEQLGTERKRVAEMPRIAAMTRAARHERRRCASIRRR